MNLIIIHKSKNSTTSSGDNLFRFAISGEPIAGVILDGLSTSLCRPHSIRRPPAMLRGWARKTICAIPEGWSIKPWVTTPKIISYTENVPICPEFHRKTRRDSWLVVSNGRFATQINSELLERVLADIQADVVAVNVEPEVLGKREKIRLAAQGKVAGFRRFYFDSAEPAPVPADWPHHIFVRTNVLDRVLTDRALPRSFDAFLERCQSNALTLRAVNVGGVVLDLGTESGLLNFCRTRLSKIRSSEFKIRNSNTISQDSRLVGKVLLGKNVHIGPKVVIVGPSIIGDNVTIEQGAVIDSSVIGPDVCVPQNQLVRNCIVRGPQYNWERPARYKSRNLEQISYPRFDLSLLRGADETFSSWARFSYVGSIKRIVDCFAAIIVLILFAPILPFIALAIKLTSPGPVFFKDKRQGLRGQEFYCLKFRTMAVGADKIQDKLRIVSRVDGPQFKMADDPRVSAVGKFLRDTYIDEIPQFLNVLLGQMSVVGPRPSPESENTLCPSWRDARLSVRPGITGLWQVYRTRQPMKDFQEWIYYDTSYIRNLSLKTDLWICWQTVKKLGRNFLNQF
jgi:lipopolysaccharide/colanic/teichoic acid biosynthesis glycosyltransferase/acetyltransferase-like isoleucine patch superfamily enzyme